uniref:NADH dehydrogenase subunit 5 n=1 Tax=Dalbulus maidis TaxID=74065 RepID=UPI0022FD77B8|nr:NADH dehydrogenase subunit 5 [Dalbulus maidis]WAS32280.1 NADH dehydrogenase subunit 5 [Dalbulus maidis]
MWSFIFFIMSISFLLLSMVFLLLNTSLMVEWVLLSYNSVSVVYVLYFDFISMIFMFVVFLISSMVLLYSEHYMGDYNYSSLRFLYLVLLFVFSMFLMVISPNVISILLGWDGLGLVSYSLVIYYNSVKSYLAGMITCLINRLGDIGLLISVGWLISYGSWTFMFYLGMYDYSLYFLLILSSFTKSAQIPFSSWLPAAMAAPTPVSSLVHSSTLVTAGVYLLLRFFNSYFIYNHLFLFISMMTMIMSSICASYEFDLSKIIALSTLSQLGLMMSCIFMGYVDLSFFHLLSHAMFKSLLFLCSGIIIHFMGGCQDIRLMGCICLSMPLVSCCFNISNMALCGFPFMSGFYSKDLIIESCSFVSLNFIFMFLFYISLGLTVFYSLRLFYYSILMKFNYFSFLNLGDSIFHMMYSILILCLFSICFGCMYMWIMNLDFNFVLLPVYLKIMILFMVMMGLYLGFEFSLLGYYFLPYSVYCLNGSMWFMYSYSSFFYSAIYLSSKNITFLMHWGEYYGGEGISLILLKISNYFQFYYFNSLSIFMVMIFIWILFLL